MSAKRETTFSIEETYLLIECVAQKIDILENKRTDSVSNGAKKKPWENVAEVFEKDPNLVNRSIQNLEAKGRQWLTAIRNDQSSDLSSTDSSIR
uniref:Regulatory protein zeste n=1 Tax=Romanomermis culicivorax TaxID=13658 RepID=A0A915KDR3_ROMCU